MMTTIISSHISSMCGKVWFTQADTSWIIIVCWIETLPWISSHIMDKGSQQFYSNALHWHMYAFHVWQFEGWNTILSLYELLKEDCLTGLPVTTNFNQFCKDILFIFVVHRRNFGHTKQWILHSQQFEKMFRNSWNPNVINHLLGCSMIIIILVK